ncbi:hypothetical protein QAD02_006912 [Eretmocerus hayati]|uniref:Uncharacterized protein n=1 Tax=Eretmocerus hayati TaxID=131215 RepID=A0ACC2N6K8_9HYME|nr:hypothetical protein QAD02_006912 [Eretmocerus hayati]
MAESNNVKSVDGLEDNLTSEEWTIIDNKKESKDDDESADAENSEKSDDAEEIDVSKEMHHSTGDTPTKSGHIEECTEATGRDSESDDIEILSYESGPEHTIVEEGRVQVVGERQIELKAPSYSKSGNPISNILIACSVVILILGVMYATMGELKDIEGKLKELNDVKVALNRMKLSMPDLQGLEYKSQFSRYNAKYEVYSENSIDQTKAHNVLNANSINDRLEMLEITHQNLCSTISKINSSNSVFGDICKTPKILTDMITFKKNLKRAHEETRGTTSPDKRFFSLLEEKLDYVSESLLAEVSVIFLKFSGKITDRLSKFGHRLDRMYAQLCSSKISGDMDDEFLKAFLNEDFHRRICKDAVFENRYVTENPKLNKTLKKKKSRNYNVSKKLTEADVPDKDRTELRKPQGPDNNSYEKFNNQEFYNFKSKGDMKVHEEWKKNKHERREDAGQNYEKFDGSNENMNRHWDKKYRELHHKVSDQDSRPGAKENCDKCKEARIGSVEYRRKNPYETHNIENENVEVDSGEKFEHLRNGRKNNENFGNLGNDQHANREFEHRNDFNDDDQITKNKHVKKDSFDRQNFDREEHTPKNNIERDEHSANNIHQNRIDTRSDHNNEDHRPRQDFSYHESKKDEKYRQKNSRFEAKTVDHGHMKKSNGHQFENKFNNNKQNFDSKHERRNYKIFDDSDIVNEWEDYKSSREEELTHQRSSEYLPRSNDLKGTKSTKYRGNERKYKEDVRNAEDDWQLKRGEARAQMRNSESDNWFLDRADSRRWARSNEPHFQKDRIPPSPPPRQEPYRNEQQNSWRGSERPPIKKKSFKNRVMDKIGRTFRSLGLI